MFHLAKKIHNCPRFWFNITISKTCHGDAEPLKTDRSLEFRFAIFGEFKTPEGIQDDQKVIDHGNLPRWPPSTCFGHVKAWTWSRLSSRLFQSLVTHFSYVYIVDAAAVEVPFDTKSTTEKAIREKERVRRMEKRKKFRTGRRGVIALFSAPFEVAALSALCSSSQVFFL